MSSFKFCNVHFSAITITHLKLINLKLYNIRNKSDIYLSALNREAQGLHCWITGRITLLLLGNQVKFVTYNNLFIEEAEVGRLFKAESCRHG